MTNIDNKIKLMSESETTDLQIFKIKDQIELAGFDSVFLDHDEDKGIRTGEEWEKRLYDEMRATHILIMSPQNQTI